MSRAKKSPWPFFSISNTLKFSLVLALFALLSFFFLDHPIAKFLRPLLPIYKLQAKICSYLITPLYPFIFGSLFLILWLTKVKHVRLRLLFEVTITQLIAGGLVRLLKVIIGRARPKALWDQGLNDSRLSNLFQSFPSGHVMAAFALAATLALTYPRFSPLFFGIAFCLSLSRVLLLNHYLSDLFGTAILAIATAHIVHNYLQGINPMGLSAHKGKK